MKSNESLPKTHGWRVRPIFFVLALLLACRLKGNANWAAVRTSSNLISFPPPIESGSSDSSPSTLSTQVIAEELTWCHAGYPSPTP